MDEKNGRKYVLVLLSFSEIDVKEKSYNFFENLCEKMPKRKLVPRAEGGSKIRNQCRPRHPIDPTRIRWSTAPASITASRIEDACRGCFTTLKAKSCPSVLDQTHHVPHRDLVTDVRARFYPQAFPLSKSRLSSPWLATRG